MQAGAVVTEIPRAAADLEPARLDIDRVVAFDLTARAPDPLSAEDALTLSDWYCRYALDRLADSVRKHHAGVRSHATAAASQLTAVVGLLDPVNDLDFLKGGAA